MTIIDDIERERRAFLERFGKSPKVVTVPRARRNEFAPIIGAVSSALGFYAGLEVRYNSANQVVACSLK